MARILPDIPFHPATHGEHAEKLVVDRLATLPNGYTIIRNVDICTKGGRSLSELDIAVVTPSGFLAVLEVKAGDLTATDGEIVRDYQGEKKNVLKQFFKQSVLINNRLRTFEENLAFYQYFVLPTGILEGDGVGIASDQVYDSRNLDTLADAIRAMEVRVGADPDYEVDVDALIEFLLNTYTVRPNVSSISPLLDERCREIASGLARWVPRIQSPLAVVEITAPAGAGKTQLAVKLLEEAVKQGQRAAYVNFTLNLADRIRRLPVAGKARFIGTWHELACEAAGEYPDCTTGDELHAFYDRVSNDLISDLDVGRYQWDLIVVDDAHALAAEWVAALTGALSETGMLYVLSDPYQPKQGDRAEFSESLRIEFNESARVPQRQAVEMQLLGLVDDSFVTLSPYAGEHTAIYGPYASDRDMLRMTEKAVYEALAKGYQPEQIAILSFKGRQRSYLLQRHCIGSHTLKKPLDQLVNGEQRFSDGEIYTDTVYRFKGLQAPYVIVTEMDFETLGEKEKAALYMAMTRCSMQLAFVMSERALGALNT